ncbi:hypothetical protein KHA80_06075 [Anaerobacillus sp. HL2]|nr:hypothetical protein KHA80_06075 [Anaerobacillus sp. HL2]
MKPNLILFDEPFSGLDPAALQDFVKLLDRLSESGHTIYFRHMMLILLIVGQSNV